MDFLWTESPKWGTCITCGTAADPDGFVDLIAETVIKREDYEMIGTVDIVLCAKCLTQAARAIGAIPKTESEELIWSNKQLEERLATVADEAVSWQQRYENLVEIMSLINPKEKASNGNSDKPIESLFTGSPTGDTRIQESDFIPTEPTKKRTTRK